MYMYIHKTHTDIHNMSNNIIYSFDIYNNVRFDD